MDREKLGQALVNAKKISKSNLKHAIAMHDKIGGDFPRLLVKLGYIVDDDLTATIAELEGIEAVDITQLIIPKALVRSIRRNVLEKHNVLPIKKKDGQITLAMADINDFEAIEEIQFLTSCRVEPILASREAILRETIKLYDEADEEESSDQSQVSGDGLRFALQGEGSSFFLQAVVELLLEKGLLSKEEIWERYKKLHS